MKVQDVMTEDVKSCRPETNLAAAVGLMWRADCGALPVVVDGGKLIGVITDRDIAIALGTRNLPASEIPVSEVMSKQVFSCTPDEDIRSALKSIRKDKVRRLPVVTDDGVLRGILSLNDVVLHAEKFDGHKTTDLTYEDVVNTFKAVCDHGHIQPSKALVVP